MRRPLPLFLCLFTALCVPILLAAQAPTFAGCAVLPPDNVWNARVDGLPVDANSDAYVRTIGAASGAHPEFGSNPGGGIPITKVPGSQPKVQVTFRYESDAGPYPIPSNAAIEAGSQSTGDRHVLVVDSSNCVDYELFSAYPNSNSSWSAGSGAIFPLSSNRLRTSGWTSADAAGLPILPGLIRYDEVASGTIRHAIRFTASVTANTFKWPARHEASNVSGSDYPPMGQRFRLKKTFDISPYPVHVQVILTALKNYGMLLADNGGPWFLTGVPDARWNDDELHTLTQVLGSNFEAVDESSLIVDPNSAQAKGNSSGGNGFTPGSWLQVISAKSGACLDVTGGPAAIQPAVGLQQWTCSGTTNQAFQFTPVAGGYKVTAQNSGLQLDVRGASSAAGALVIQWPFWGGLNEIWRVTEISGGVFTITAESTGMCLDVRGASIDNGAPVTQWPCQGGDNQKWAFHSAQ